MDKFNTKLINEVGDLKLFVITLDGKIYFGCGHWSEMTNSYIAGNNIFESYSDAEKRFAELACLSLS